MPSDNILVSIEAFPKRVRTVVLISKVSIVFNAFIIDVGQDSSVSRVSPTYVYFYGRANKLFQLLSD